MGESKKYFWLKLKDDFFNQPKIKKLRRIAGGDTYTIIYLKMQLLSLKNEGRLLYEGTEDNFVDEIALCIDEEPENVGVTINYLLRQGLLAQSSELEFSLPQAMQSMGSETSGAERVRKFRERQKMLSNGAEQGQNGQKALQRNADVTSCNTEIEKEIEIELELDKEREKEKQQDEDPPDDERPAPPLFHVPYEQIKDLYNRLCPSLPKCTAMSEARKKAIKARFSSGYTMEDFQRLFEKTEASSFLKGANSRNWRASFDWITKDANMAKVLDGNYDDHGLEQRQPPQQQSSNPFLEMLREEEARNGQNRDY